MLNNYKKEDDKYDVEVFESLGEIKDSLVGGANNKYLNEIAGLFLIIDFDDESMRFNFWYHEDKYSKDQIEEYIQIYKSNLDNIIFKTK